MELTVGIKNKTTDIATPENSAKNLGSGTVDVFATPMMILLIENTASRSVIPYLNSGEATVGTLVNIKHISATPIGMKLWCETELVEVDGKRLVFKAEVYDECGKVGEGIHERFIINAQRFIEKANSKLKKD